MIPRASTPKKARSRAHQLPGGLIQRERPTALTHKLSVFADQEGADVVRVAYELADSLAAGPGVPDADDSLWTACGDDVPARGRRERVDGRLLLADLGVVEGEQRCGARGRMVDVPQLDLAVEPSRGDKVLLPSGGRRGQPSQLFGIGSPLRPDSRVGQASYVVGVVADHGRGH